MIEEIINKIHNHYDFDDVKITKEIKGGVFNQHFLIKTNKGKYVLRLSNKTRTFSEVNFEIDLINHINDLQVLKFIKNNDNQIVTNIDNRIIVISLYCNGKIPNKITDNLIKETGAFLGKFHSKIKSFKTKYKRKTVYYFSNKRLNKIKNILIKELFPLKNEIIFVYDILKNYQFDKSFEWGVCHLDMKPGNSLVKNNKIELYLDFDNCEYNALILDVGRALKWWCYDEKGYSKKKVSIFLNEYEKYRSLTVLEKKSIKRSIIVAIASQLFYIYHLYLYAWENQDEFFVYYRDKFLRHLRNLVDGDFYG